MAALIAAAVAAVYAQTVGFGYVFDDVSYITGNPGLAKGLTAESLRWAFTSTHHANWHPLAWIAHLLDRAVFGAAPGPAHLVNAGLHAACGALLFLVLRRLTGSLLPSACAAALFALHPLRVESVAWVTERKDALSTIFWILALGAHLCYARRPGPGRYALVAGLLAMGLLTKPMVVTLPGVLLLLDYWPLGRYRPGRAGGVPLTRLLLEKVPLLLLSTAVSAAAIASQQSVGALQALERLPLGMRLANAPISGVIYLRDTFWPVNLAAFYPYPVPGGQLVLAMGATLLLAVATLLALRFARRAPALATGWLWYLGTLVPVIGVIQVGMQGHADRYTYLPSIGLMVALVWGIAPLIPRRWRRPGPATAIVFVALGALAVASWRQSSFWRDDVTLYRRMLAVTERNWLAENNLGRALADKGDRAAGMEHYRRALAYRPHFEDPYFNMGLDFEELGRPDEALAAFQRALQIKPELAEAQVKIGGLLADRGLRGEAIRAYREALRGLPELAVLHMNLANSLSDAGEYGEALAHYATALRLTPNDAGVYANRGVTYLQMGQSAAASADFREALRLDPKNPTARNGLGLR